MTENKKENQGSPSWQLFWQEHGQSLLQQEEEDNFKKELLAEKAQCEAPAKFDEQRPAFMPAAGVTEKEPPAAKKRNKKAAPGGAHKLTAKVRNLSQKHKTVLVFCLCLALFLAVTAGAGYTVYEKLQNDKAEIAALVEEKTAAIKAENSQSFAEINQRLSEMGGEIDDLLAIMDDTDDAIVASGAESRDALSKKISQLDKQLNELKASLAILMEDKNAQ